MLMGKTVGYMITFTTYGSWLQGDRRGFVKDGKIISLSDELEQDNKKRQNSDKVSLTKEQREIVRGSILREAEKIRENVLAVSVRSNHVHAVIEGSGKPIDTVMSRFKTAAYYAMRDNGFKGKLWTRGCDRRFCFSEKELRARVDYVSSH
jgi:REP element-mobilizing transposase RayT